MLCRIALSLVSRSAGSGYRRAAVVLVVAAHVLGAARASDGVETLGISFHDRTRAGVDVAIGDTALSQVLNPANLTHYERFRFDFATSHIFPSIRWTGPLDQAESTARHIPLAGFAIAGPLGERWHGGVAVNAKSGLLSCVHFRHLAIPWMRRRVGADVKNILISANLAHRTTERLSLGVGLNFELITARFSEVLGPVDLEFERGGAVGLGFQVGARFELTPTVTLAGGWRSPTWFGDVAGGGARASLGGVLPVNLGAARMADFELPQRATVGVAWRPTERLLLGAEVRYVHHRGTSLDQLELRAARLGELRVELPLGYRNQWIFKIGGEYRLDKHWVIGAGYSYSTDPIDATALRAIASVMTQHHASVGVRYETKRWWAGVGYGIAFPTGMNAKGTRIPLALDYAFNRVDHMQHVAFAGFGFSLN